jgi:hypothetical protein
MIVTCGPRRQPRITHGAEPASTAFRSCFTGKATEESLMCGIIGILTQGSGQLPPSKKLWTISERAI